MQPMTDEELRGLWKKHVPEPGHGHAPDPRREFIGTPYYRFARELEHHALAAGMLVTFNDPVRRQVSPTAPDSPQPGLWALIGAAVAKLWS